MDWVLIIWTITCGWSCYDENVQQFAIYESAEECQEGLLDWTVTERSRNMTLQYQINRYQRGAQCMKRPRRRN